MIRLFFIIIVLYSFLISNDSKKLKVVFPKNFPPSFIYIDNKPSGYGIELFDEIKKDLNLEVEYLPQDSWKDVFNLMKSGEADIIPNQGITEDRKKYFNYTQEVQYINISIFSKKGNKVLGVESLAGKKVGVIRTNIAFNILKKYKDIDLKIFDEESHFFDDFMLNNLDFIVYTEPSILNIAKKRGVLNKIEKNFDLAVIHRGVAVNKNNLELLSKINKSIDKLKNNGKLYEIYNKWHKEEKKYSEKDVFLIFLVLILIPIFLILYLNYKKIILTRKELEQELKRKTELLNESKEKFEFSAERALNGYWELNLGTNKVKCSDSWFDTLGINKSEFNLSLENIKRLVHKDDRENNEKAIKRMIENNKLSYSKEIRVKHSNGKYIWIHTLGTIYKNEKKEKILFGFLININDKKELEIEKKEQESILVHQSKMAAMGEMLENIAHQWRQPLSMISTSATGVSFQKEIGVLNDEHLFEAMESINDTTQYLSHTIDDFRNYFSSNKQAQNFDVNLLMQRVVRILSSKFKNNDIKILIDSDVKFIYNLENEFMQVIINLLNNAKDVLEESNIKNKCIIISSKKIDEKVIIKIKDNAGGIPENILEKVFEPYFTTKHQSQGTGLGLYMCNEILTKHMNSSINVKNVEFEYENMTFNGAEFTITIKSL